MTFNLFYNPPELLYALCIIRNLSKPFASCLLSPLQFHQRDFSSFLPWTAVRLDLSLSFQRFYGQLPRPPRSMASNCWWAEPKLFHLVKPGKDCVCKMPFGWLYTWNDERPVMWTEIKHLETDIYAKNSMKRFHMLLSSDINAKTVHPQFDPPKKNSYLVKWLPDFAGFSIRG